MPQYVGYGPPPSVVIAVLCLVVTLTCCICGLVSICSVFLRRKKPHENAHLRPVRFIDARTKKKAAALMYVYAMSLLTFACWHLCSSLTQPFDCILYRNKDDEELAKSQEEPLLAEVHEHEIMTFEDDVDSATLERLNARRERCVLPVTQF